jgi:hypothetical protein
MLSSYFEDNRSLYDAHCSAAIYSSLILHRNLKEETHLGLNTYVAAAPGLIRIPSTI